MYNIIYVEKMDLMSDHVYITYMLCVTADAIFIFFI